MARPLAAFLTRFSDEMASAEPLHSVVRPSVDIDPAALRHQAELAELRAALEAQSRRDIDALAKSHASTSAGAVARARALWCEAEGTRMVDRIEAAFAALRAEIDARIADVLTPILAPALRERASAATLEHLDLWLTDPAHPPLSLRAPTDLLNVIKSARPGAAIGYAADDDVDVIVTADGMRLETRLGAAFAALAGHEA